MMIDSGISTKCQGSGMNLRHPCLPRSPARFLDTSAMHGLEFAW